MARSAACLLFLVVVAVAAATSTRRQAADFAPAPGSPFGVGERPMDVAVADANGDGFADVLVVSGGDRTLRVLLGDGNGAFRDLPARPLGIDAAPHLVAVADFNLDKKVDVAASSHDSNAVAIAFGDGAGGFSVAAGSPFAALKDVKPHNHGLAAGDVNADGRPDLTFGHQDAGVIAVLLGNERAGFAAASGSPFRIGRGFYPHALGDVNGDGRLDVVAPDIVGSGIVVALGDGRGGLTAAAGSPLEVRPRPFFVLLDDLNADGRLDAVATHDDVDDVDVLLGDGRGGFTAAPRLDAGHRGWTVAAADVNADGRKDLVIAGARGLRAFFGNGTGEFTHSAASSVTTPRAIWKVAVADFNGDRRPDLVFPDAETGTVSVWLHR